MNRKVTVVGGAGNVGATVARAVADKELADVVIIDIAQQKAQGVALDMYQACPIEGSDSRIIGADIGGIPELIRQGETGFVFRSGDVDALVEVLTRVQRMPVSTLADMGRAGRQWMRSEFSPAAYRDRMLSIYRRQGVAFPSSFNEAAIELLT